MNKNAGKCATIHFIMMSICKTFWWAKYKAYPFTGCSEEEKDLLAKHPGRAEEIWSVCFHSHSALGAGGRDADCMTKLEGWLPDCTKWRGKQITALLQVCSHPIMHYEGKFPALKCTFRIQNKEIMLRLIAWWSIDFPEMFKYSSPFVISVFFAYLWYTKV